MTGGLSASYQKQRQAEAKKKKKKTGNNMAGGLSALYQKQRQAEAEKKKTGNKNGAVSSQTKKGEKKTGNRNWFETLPSGIRNPALLLAGAAMSSQTKKGNAPAKAEEKPTPPKKDAVDNKRRGAELERASRHNTVKAAPKKKEDTSTQGRYGKGDSSKGAPSTAEKRAAKDKSKASQGKKGGSLTPGRFGRGDSKTVKDSKGVAKANVSQEQLKDSGMSLRQYMNKWNKTGKRPK